MKLNASAPPTGTLRDWIDFRAQKGEVAFVFPDGEAKLNWSEVCENAQRIAKALTSRGIAKGESVAIMMPNCRDGVLALLGTLYGGFRATMINLVAGDSAISYALEHSEARFAFVHSDAAENFARTAGDVCAVEMDCVGQAPLHDINADDHALLMYTSGTTGRPKGVVHTQASLLAGGWTTAIAHELTAQDRGLCVLPIYHINGLCVTVMGSMVSGGSLAMCGKFSASRFWDHADRAKTTWFSVVPTIISHLLHGKAEPSPATISRMRFGRSASSALAPDVQTAFEMRFGVPIVETMGLTETAAQILSNPLPPGVRKIGSPGIAVGNEVEILDKDFQILPPDTEGEISVRGPNVMLEYLKNSEATQASSGPGGWLRTGDLGKKDADGYVFVTGRLKELIIKGGENIAPREIDEALYSHGDVVEAAAFARPDVVYGERVEAAVALSEGASVDAATLIEVCIARLGKFKSPDIIYILDDLPKGPSGKIQRMKLVEITQQV
jgi:acyl-CoA synthetase (AMP-forming)/AMP-acid ligase II